MRYPHLSKELTDLMAEDQLEVRALGRLYVAEGGSKRYEAEQVAAHRHIDARTRRALEILDEIREPRLSYIGRDGSLALSVLALHATQADLEKVLRAFRHLFGQNRDDCAYDLIPAMQDLLLIQRGEPQEFGAQWLLSVEDNYPFLPTVAGFTTIDELNERRATYGREPLAWPNFIAMTEEQQPWLKRPLTELVMRAPTDQELSLMTSRK